MTASEILAKLVAFPVLGGQSNLSIINYIKEYLESHDVHCTMVPNPEGTKASLHCRIGPPVDGGIILSGHTDVVPTEGQDWTTEPFELTEKDGKLYARGSADMKGFLACCLACVPEMIQADLKKPIYFAFSYDEEIGCLAGTELAQAFHNYTEKPAYAIIGEPSLLQPVIGQKGICIFKTTVYGSAGHSSRIKTEVSAIHEAARLILWLENKMNTLYEEGNRDERFDPDHTSLHVGLIEGGIAPNVIADQCTFHWDVRNIPKNTAEEIYADFEKHVAQRLQVLKKKFAGTRIETIMFHPPVPTLDTPESAPVVDLIQKLSGSNQLQTVAYAAEAGQFSNEGFQAVICGPGDIAQAHRADEFIAIEQLDKGVAFIQKIIVAFS